MTICVIFGGTGFIGSHFAKNILLGGKYDKVILADIKPIRSDFIFSDDRLSYVHLDVRSDISEWCLPDKVDLIANFAAVHREPGHEYHEYYETNIPGAENVCSWASRVDCNTILFTSSIAPYGPSESKKTESSIPTPTSAYGGSKLVAEKIHVAWRRSRPGRKLIIVRPGVVFGPGEGGNVSRLVKAVLGHYFFYMGNKDTRKAGGYVKELVNTMNWALSKIDDEELLYNFTMESPPTVRDYVKVICKVAKVERTVFTIPYRVLLFISYLFDFPAKFFGINQPISPVRIKKLVRSNNIFPGVLMSRGYEYIFTLEEAMADWRKDRPDEW